MHTEEKQPINGLLFLWWKSRAEMRGFMEKRARILIKLIAVAVLSGLFIWLVYKDETVLQLKQPEGAQRLGAPKPSLAIPDPIGEVASGHPPKFSHGCLASLLQLLRPILLP